MNGDQTRADVDGCGRRRVKSGVETISTRCCQSIPQHSTQKLQFVYGLHAAAGSAPRRAHHFTPQCWLAGFTDTGRKDGRLFVTDLKRQKQWPTTPPNAGRRRDFYQVRGSNLFNSEPSTMFVF